MLIPTQWHLLQDALWWFIYPTKRIEILKKVIGLQAMARSCFTVNSWAFYYQKKKSVPYAYSQPEIQTKVK